MIISVASGKGGTGKTTVAVNLALSIEHAQILDCDVEEPNVHLFLKPVLTKTIPAHTPIPVINETRCTWCGRCQQVCAYNALAVLPPSEPGKNGSVLVFEHLCHGCGACVLLCPAQAISETGKEIGRIETGCCGSLQFAQGILNIGEVMAPPLIRQVKQCIDPEATVIVDAPPGTSCPVIAALQGSDFCVLVTEPTPFGLHDLTLAVDVVRKLRIPFGVVINRADIGDDKTVAYCREHAIPVLLAIPFDQKIAEAYACGIPIVEAQPAYKHEFLKLFTAITAGLRQPGTGGRNE